MKYVLLIADDQIRPRDITKIFKKPTPRNLSSILTDWANASQMLVLSSRDILPSFVEQLIWTLASDDRILPLHTAMTSLDGISMDIDTCHLKSLLTMIEFRQGSKLGTALGNLCEYWEGHPFTALILDLAWSSGVPEVIESIANASDDNQAATELSKYRDKCREQPSEYITDGLQWMAQGSPTIPVLVSTQHDSEESRRLTTACTKVGAAFGFRKQDVTHESQKMLKQLIGACLVACRRHAAGLPTRPQPLPSMLEPSQEGIESLCGKTVADILLVSSEDAEFVQALLEEFFPPAITPWLVIRSDDDLTRIDLSRSPEIVVFFPADVPETLGSPALTKLLRFAASQNHFTPFAKRVHLIFHCWRPFHLYGPLQLPRFLQHTLGDSGLHTMPQIEWISLDWNEKEMWEVVGSLIRSRWAPSYYKALTWPNSEELPEDLEKQLRVGPKVMDCAVYDGIRNLKGYLFDFLRNPRKPFEDSLPVTSTLEEMLDQWAEGEEEPFQTRVLRQLPGILQDCYQIAEQLSKDAERMSPQASEYDQITENLMFFLTPLNHLQPGRSFTLWTPQWKSRLVRDLEGYLGGLSNPNPQDAASGIATRLLLEFYALYHPRGQQEFEWERLTLALKAKSILLDTYPLDSLIQQTPPSLYKKWNDSDITYIKHILVRGERENGLSPAESRALRKIAPFDNTIRWDAVADLLSPDLAKVNHSPLLLPFLLYKAQAARTDQRRLIYVYLAYLLDPFCVRIVAELLEILRRLRREKIYERVLMSSLEWYNTDKMWFTCEEDFLRLGVPHFLHLLAEKPDKEMRYPVEVDFARILEKLKDYPPAQRAQRQLGEGAPNLRLWQCVFSNIASYKDIRPVERKSIPTDPSTLDDPWRRFEQKKEG